MKWDTSVLATDSRINSACRSDIRCSAIIHLVKEKIGLACGPAAEAVVEAAARVKNGVVVKQKKKSDNAI